MLVSSLFTGHSSWLWLFGLLILLTCRFAIDVVRSYWRLRHINGPFLASLSNLPRLLWVVNNKAHDVHIDLHRQYGHIVRLGPKMVSIDDPAEISRVYGIDGKFVKVILPSC